MNENTEFTAPCRACGRQVEVTEGFNRVTAAHKHFNDAHVATRNVETQAERFAMQMAAR